VTLAAGGVIRAELARRWDEYDAMCHVDRAVVDDRRLVPVEETRRILVGALTVGFDNRGHLRIRWAA
jgi:hypothetical protein